MFGSAWSRKGHMMTYSRAWKLLTYQVVGMRERPSHSMQKTTRESPVTTACLMTESAGNSSGLQNHAGNSNC